MIMDFCGQKKLPLPNNFFPILDFFWRLGWAAPQLLDLRLQGGGQKQKPLTLVPDFPERGLDFCYLFVTGGHWARFLCRFILLCGQAGLDVFRCSEQPNFWSNVQAEGYTTL